MFYALAKDAGVVGQEIGLVKKVGGVGWVEDQVDLVSKEGWLVGQKFRLVSVKKVSGVVLGRRLGW